MTFWNGIKLPNYESDAQHTMETAIGNDYTCVQTIRELMWESLCEKALEEDPRLIDDEGETIEGAEEMLDDASTQIHKDLCEAINACGIEDTLSEVKFFNSVGGWEGYYGTSRWD